MMLHTMPIPIYKVLQYLVILYDAGYHAHCRNAFLASEAQLNVFLFSRLFRIT